MSKNIWILLFTGVFNGLAIIMLKTIINIEVPWIVIMIALWLYSIVVFSKKLELKNIGLKIYIDSIGFLWHSFISFTPILWGITKLIENIRDIKEPYISNGIIYIALGIISHSSYQLIFPKFKIKEITCHTRKKIKSLKIVLLSDLHMNTVTNNKFIKRLVDTVKEINPEIILVTGDIISSELTHLHEKLSLLSHMKPRHGTFYISGNDDYSQNIEDVKKTIKKELNWHYLSNECLKINELDLTLIGVEDPFWQKNKKKERNALTIVSEKIKKLVSETTYNILLYHRNNPELLKHHPKIDMQLSGHTHGGQFWPMTWITRWTNKYSKGYYKINKNQHFYISQGTGYSRPEIHRLGTQNEITVINITQI
ncbi:MAG: metallophosphoesterase [bacterium]